jgi:uncharacterized membrane protein YfcA
MDALSAQALAALVATAFCAGFVDAIAGGGGLITIPAMTLAGLDPLTAVATNKLQASFGSGSATLAFARKGFLVWQELRWVVAASAGGAIIGALLLARVPVEGLAAALPFLLVSVALYFAWSPRLSDEESRARLSKPMFVAAIVPLIGAYDGFFGPGTGSFFMLAFVSLLGYGAVHATAHTKAANFASNVAGLVTLGLSGYLLWPLGLAMGVAQFCGAALGARAAMAGGARLVRPLLICVCLLLAARMAADRFEFVRNLFAKPPTRVSLSVDAIPPSRL